MKYESNIYYEDFEEIPVLFIEGDMTSGSDSETKKIFLEITKSYPLDKIILNFSKTKYINSSGIAILISIIQKINEKSGQIAFVGMSDHFTKVMDIVGIIDFVQIYATNEQAIETMKA